MLMSRIIPCLLLKEKGLVKSIKFKDYNYIGDPINAVKIFNDKEVDELIFIDIEASKRGSIDYKLLEKIASQSFMPLCYGGGVRTIEDMRRIYYLGFEKISLNSEAIKNPEFIKKAAEIFGNQSVIVTIDVKKNLFGKYKLFNHIKKKILNYDIIAYTKKMQEFGAGEILINSVDNDGMMKGYDLELIKNISHNLEVPVIALGGAGSLEDLGKVINEAGASAAAAGSLFIYQGPHKAVLINYPEQKEILKLLK